MMIYALLLGYFIWTLNDHIAATPSALVLRTVGIAPSLTSGYLVLAFCASPMGLEAAELLVDRAVCGQIEKRPLP